MQFYLLLSLCVIFSGIYAAPMNKDFSSIPVNKLNSHLFKREDSADRSRGEQPLGAFTGVVIPDVLPGLISTNPLGGEADQD
ncbi:hypothetical protein EDC94DRAFT_629143 [Helicostylum pulchrum]|nr:hypothetical protein EDC94DRAFT_629143 [Helicostylum pulchrum]